MRLPWQITVDMFLSEGEIDQLLAFVGMRLTAAPLRRRGAAMLDRLIVEGLIFSGLRNSEFCRLKLADTSVGTNHAELRVTASVGVGRTVYIPQRLCELIDAYVHHARPHLLPSDVAADDPSQPLVFNERRRPYERSGLYRRVCRILEAAELGERASVQLLRHTYGFLAYKRTGGNLLFVQRQMGHAHPIITSVYAQLIPESYEVLAQAVDVREICG